MQSVYNGLKLLITNRITRWLLIGNSILSVCQFLLSFCLLRYINFYRREKIFAVVNAFCVVIGGCTSCLASGQIAQMYDKKTYRAKSIVSSTMCAIAVPLCVLLFTIQKFAASCTFVFLYDLLCLGYYVPVICMIQASVDVQNKGAAIGAF